MDMLVPAVWILGGVAIAGAYWAMALSVFKPALAERMLGRGFPAEARLSYRQRPFMFWLGFVVCSAIGVALVVTGVGRLMG